MKIAKILLRPSQNIPISFQQNTKVIFVNRNLFKISLGFTDNLNFIRIFKLLLI